MTTRFFEPYRHLPVPSQFRLYFPALSPFIVTMRRQIKLLNMLRTELRTFNGPILQIWSYINLYIVL